MTKRIFIYLLIALVAAAGVWFALKPGKKAVTESPRTPEAVETKAVTFAGKLSARNVELFLEEVKGKKITMLVISSGTGEIDAGIKMGAWVFDNRIDVTVENLCLSSCANYVFTAGRRKIIKPGAVVAWHGTALEEPGLSDEEVRRSVIEDFNAWPEGDREKANLEELIGKAIAQARLQRAERIGRHLEFFRKIGVDESVCRIGNEKYGAKDFFFLSAKDMGRFGISGVEAPADYENTDLIPLLVKGKQIEFIRLGD